MGMSILALVIRLCYLRNAIDAGMPVITADVYGITVERNLCRWLPHTPQGYGWRNR